AGYAAAGEFERDIRVRSGGQVVEGRPGSCELVGLSARTAREAVEQQAEAVRGEPDPLHEASLVEDGGGATAGGRVPPELDPAGPRGGQQPSVRREPQDIDPLTDTLKDD